MLSRTSAMEAAGLLTSLSKFLASSALALKVAARWRFIGLPTMVSSGRLFLPNMLLVMLTGAEDAVVSVAVSGVAVPTGVPLVEVLPERSAEC